MDDAAWPEEFEKRQAARPGEQSSADDEFAWEDDVASDDLGASFVEQIVSGSWPVRDGNGVTTIYDKCRKSF
jgi:hypothetical protein